MIIEAALVAELAAAGTTAGARIYPQPLPQQATLPAITYLRVSTLREHTLTSPDHLPAVRFQLDCWADTLAETLTLKEEVRVALDGFNADSGLMGGAGGVVVQACHLDNERAVWSPLPNRYQATLDFIVKHNEP